MTDTVTAYPLCWPAGRNRVPPHKRDRSNFRTTADKARRGLEREVDLLGGQGLIISTDVPIRKDGRPYASGFRLDDEAVAVYFRYYGKSMCFACDRWQTLRENMHGIAMTIEALRGIARWGPGDMLERAFTGYAALPAPTAASDGPPWWKVLCVDERATQIEITNAYRRARSEFHPDRNPGKVAAVHFDLIQKAYEQALAEGRE